MGPGNSYHGMMSIRGVSAVRIPRRNPTASSAPAASVASAATIGAATADASAASTSAATSDAAAGQIQLWPLMGDHPPPSSHR
ncbi:hypothetical protein ACMFMG_004410 [Clarireedia jacksonii]